MGDVFISYAREDAAVATEIARGLEAAAYTTWYYQRDSNIPGPTYLDVIAEAIEQCKACLVVLSEHALESPQVDREMVRAHERDKRLIPLLWGINFDAIEQRRSSWRMMIGSHNAVEIPPEDVASIVPRILRGLATWHIQPGGQPAPSAQLSPEAVRESRRSLTRGLESLPELMQAPGVREAVGASKADFAAATERITTLADYKELHDALHRLEFNCYSQLLRETRRAAVDGLDWDALTEYELGLAGLLEDLQRVAARESVPNQDTTWIGDIAEAHLLFRSATETYDAQQLERVVGRLNRILARRPSQINHRLTDAAGALRLPALHTAMLGICEHLPAAGPSFEKAQRFKQAVDDLGRLAVSLGALVEEHGLWQDIDGELRVIDALMVGRDVADLEDSWSSIRDKVSALTEASQHPLAVRLRAQRDKLDAALAAGDPVQIREAFGQYWRSVGLRFYSVDTDLKQLCAELSKVREPLRSFLESLE